MSEESPEIGNLLGKNSKEKAANPSKIGSKSDSTLSGMINFWTEKYGQEEAERRTRIIEATRRRPPAKTK